MEDLNLESSFTDSLSFFFFQNEIQWTIEVVGSYSDQSIELQSCKLPLLTFFSEQMS
jgi:hypothetical protein